MTSPKHSRGRSAANTRRFLILVCLPGEIFTLFNLNGE